MDGTNENSGTIQRQFLDPNVLPGFLQPGVGHPIRLALHAILLTLNAFLLYCAWKGTFRPHFEIMFVMSSVLTGLYSWFIWELEKAENREREAKQEEAVRKAAQKLVQVRKNRTKNTSKMKDNKKEGVKEI